MDVGARLKEARIAKGLSLESLQETTKIQKRYLVAIEEGNFHLLPGKFYARAFIKEYATAVGLDSNDLLEEHKEEIPKSEMDSEIQYTRVERSRENAIERTSVFFSILPKIIVGLLIVGIISAGIWFYSQSTSPNEPTEIEEPSSDVVIRDSNEGDSATSENEEETDESDNTDEEPEEDTEEEQEEEIQFEVEQADEDTGSTPESIISLTNSNDELIFTFESEENVWFEVRNEQDEVFYSGSVTSETSPEEIDLTGQERIFLNIGSTPNLDITINGVPFDYPIDPSERDHQHVWFHVN